jgi:hypothetical protein
MLHFSLVISELAYASVEWNSIHSTDNKHLHALSFINPCNGSTLWL